MIGRIFITVLAFIAYSWIAGLFDPIATLVTGSVAGNQFDSSNASYLNTMAIFSLMSWVFLYSVEKFQFCSL